MSALNEVSCPGCGHDVMATAVACPHCGRTNFVEHPGDIVPVKHPTTDLPAADAKSFGEKGDRFGNDQKK